MLRNHTVGIDHPGATHSIVFLTNPEQAQNRSESIYKKGIFQ